MNGNIDQTKLLNMLLKASGGKIGKSAVNGAKRGDLGAVLSALPPEEKEKLKKALADKNAAQKILNGAEAQQILRSIIKDNSKNG